MEALSFFELLSSVLFLIVVAYKMTWDKQFSANRTCFFL